jgi:hypothetical protein
LKRNERNHLEYGILDALRVGLKMVLSVGMVLTIDDSTGTLDVIIYKKSDTDTPEMLDNIELK